MLKVNKAPEPESFMRLRTSRKINTWDDLYENENRDFAAPLYAHTRQYMLDNEQRCGDVYLCPYCERRLRPPEIHMEHIKPRSKFPEEEFAYNNVILSCEDPGSCGRYKANKWDDSFINPVEKDPARLFRYRANGKIGEDDNRVKITISILNLHNDALVSARRALFLRISSYPSDFIDELDKYFPEFPNLIHYYQEQFRPCEQD